MELPAEKDGLLLADFDLPAHATLVAPMKASELKAFQTIVRPYNGHLVPAAIRAELNADTDRDILIRMRHLARKKRMRHPEITDEEMADYLALAENCANFEHWLKFRRSATEHRASRGTFTWLLSTVAIIGLLATGLIAAIAVSVSAVPLTG
jgi:hypothetical protein